MQPQKKFDPILQNQCHVAIAAEPPHSAQLGSRSFRSLHSNVTLTHRGRIISEMNFEMDIGPPL